MKPRVSENFLLRVVALLAAASLWLFVTMKGQTEFALAAPIELVNIPDGMVVTDQSTKTVSVFLRGYKKLLENVEPSDVTVIVDMNNTTEKDNLLLLDKDAVELPSAVSVTNIEPSYIEVSLEKLFSRTVRIRHKLTGSPARGFQLKNVTVSPEMVRVEGIKKELRRLPTPQMELDISGAAGTVTKDFRVEFLDRELTVTPESVTITATIVNTTAQPPKEPPKQ